MFKNVNFYTFAPMHIDLDILKSILLEQMIRNDVKGTILISPEGINAALSGAGKQVDHFVDFISQSAGIQLQFIKESFSEAIAFKRMRIKIKKNIVAAPGVTPIDCQKDKAPYISPRELHAWILEKKEIVLLDTRNDYEADIGAFKSAVHLGTKHFNDFEEDLNKAPKEWRDKMVVTYCTGGIRCEKAAPLLLKKGYRHVYQLEGGILNYFKDIGQGFFEGDCFVFDERVAVDSQLNPKSHANNQ